MSEKRVPPYADGVQQKEELTTRTFQYVHPFNDENVVVDRQYNCGEFQGLEMNPINSYWPQTERRPADGIIIEEEDPIVRVVVIGSACTPPGYVTLECELAAGFRRNDEVEQVMPGTVFLAFHYREAPANRLTIAALDPVAKIPEFKVCAVRIRQAR